MGEARCRRCGTDVEKPAWHCWLCGGELCDDCGDRHGHCDHDEPALDEIDRLWATADEAKRAELLELMRKLAEKYGDRGPMLLRSRRPPTSRN
jgi:predicted amidophosphoribosyltransferase